MHFNGAVCSALSSHLFILPDGKVTICEQLYWNPRFIIGDAKKSGLKEIWQSPEALHLCNLSRKDLSRQSKCKACTYLKNASNTETGVGAISLKHTAKSVGTIRTRDASLLRK